MRLLISFVLVFYCRAVYATAQTGDVLVIEEDTLALFSEPLERYFEQKGKRTLSQQEINWTSTDCYRGYRAVWKIEENCLFLIEIRKGCHTNELYNICSEFGEKVVLAEWFSGELLIPSGKPTHYVHGGYLSLYQYETIFEIENGNLRSRVKFDNSNSYQSIYTQNIDSLRNYIYEKIDWDNIDFLDRAQRVVAQIKSGRDKYTYKVNLIKECEKDILNKKAYQVLKSLPEWSVYYKRGKPYNIEWTVPIIFSEEIRKKHSR